LIVGHHGGGYNSPKVINHTGGADIGSSPQLIRRLIAPRLAPVAPIDRIPFPSYGRLQVLPLCAPGSGRARTRPPMIRSIDAVGPDVSTDGARAMGAANSAPATSGTTSLPLRASVRHADRWFAFSECRRATSFTVTPGTSVSATMRPFASSDHRRLAAGTASSSTNPTAFHSGSETRTDHQVWKTAEG
jgi:hypothetical protein